MATNKPSHRGHSLSAATRAKLSAQRKGKHHPHRGHAMSASARAKLSAAAKARHHADRKARVKTRPKHRRILHQSRATSNALLHHTIVRSRSPLRSHRPVRVAQHRMPHTRRSRRPRRRH